MKYEFKHHLRLFYWRIFWPEKYRVTMKFHKAFQSPIVKDAIKKVVEKVITKVQNEK